MLAHVLAVMAKTAAAPREPNATGTVWTPSATSVNYTFGLEVERNPASKEQSWHERLASERANDVAGMWHGQVGQDRTVYELLGNKEGGFFIDLAAHTPVEMSNSRALERDHGWRGLCIDANPRYWGLLKAIRTCTIIGVAVADDERELLFIDKEGVGGLETFQRSVAKYARNQRSAGTFVARTAPFSSIIAAFHVPPTIDYLSLDVEGAEAWVMASFPWSKHNISVLTVERPPRALKAMLLEHGYAHICTSGFFGDELWVHKPSVPAHRYRSREKARGGCTPHPHPGPAR